MTWRLKVGLGLRKEFALLVHSLNQLINPLYRVYHSRRIIRSVLKLIFALSYWSAAAIEEGETRLLPSDFFSGLVTEETLEAEQVWVAKAPRTLGVQIAKSVLGFFAEQFGSRENRALMSRTGDLPRQFTPEARQVFSLPLFYVDPELVYEIGKRPFGGERALWTVHPYSLVDSGDTPEKIREWLRLHQASIERDDSKVLATPTSSNRSLLSAFEQNGQRDFAIFKTSSHLWTSGSSRSISRTQAVRAVVVSQIYREAYNANRGVLPLTGARWTFHPETYASIPKDLDRQALIFREKAFNLANNISSVNAYSVNVRLANGKKWIDEILAGKDDVETREKAWQLMIGPAWELLLELTFIYGVAPPLHGQNLAYQKPNGVNEIIGLILRDAESFVSKTLRAANGLLNDFGLPDWVTDDDLGVLKSTDSILESIDYFETYLMEYVFGLRFDSKDMAYFRAKNLELLQQFVLHHRSRLGFVNASSFDDFVKAIKKRIHNHEKVLESVVQIDSRRPTGLNYDEFFSADGSERVSVSHLKSVSIDVGARLQAESLSQTAGEVRYYPEPILLSETDVSVLRAATDQRLRVLRLFVEDVRSQAHRWKRVIPEQVMRGLNGGQILVGEHWPANDPYGGVDFVRNAQTGQFFTTETQVDPIPAGTTYLDMMRETYSRFYPDLRPAETLFSLVQQGVQNGDEKPVTVLLDYNVLGPAALVSSTVAQNLFLARQNAETMREKGIYLVMVDPIDQLQRDVENCLGVCLSSLNNRANFVFQDGSSTRIRLFEGRLILDIIKKNEIVESREVDYLWSHIGASQLGQFAKELLPLVEAGNLKTNYHPGLELMGNKGFQAYLDQLTELYLEEKPFVRSPETFLFVDAQGELDEARFERFFAEPARWYFKRTVGFGGSGVTPGAELLGSPEKLRRLAEEIKRNPSHYIAQEAIGELSSISGFGSHEAPALQFEMRFFGSLNQERSWVSSEAMARIAPHGAGKNNLSVSAYALTPNLGLVASSGVSNPLPSIEISEPNILAAPHQPGRAQGFAEEMGFAEFPDGNFEEPHHPLTSFFVERPDLKDPSRRMEEFELARISTQETLPLHPVPLVIGRGVFDQAQNAAAQRSRALAAFLKDYFSGEARWKSMIPAYVMDYVRKRVDLDKSFIRPDHISFVNGVDFMRGESGQLYVLEDNLTAAAGLYSNELARQHMSEIAPEWAKQHLAPSDIEQLVVHFQRLTQKRKPLILSVNYDVDLIGRLGLDPFAARVAQNQRFYGPMLKSFGIELFTVNAVEAEINSWTQSNLGFRLSSQSSTTALGYGLAHELTAKDDGSIWLETKQDSDGGFLNSPARKVDAVILGMVPSHAIDWIKPLMKAERAGHLVMTHTHGVELADNKLVQMYVEQMIRLYLNEQPIAAMPEHVLFTDENGQLDRGRLEKVFASIDQWYIKRTVLPYTGGGQGVFSGKELSRSSQKKAELLRDIVAHPLAYLAVARIAGANALPLGSEAGRAVDFRALHVHSPNESLRLNHFYSRGARIGASLLNASGANRTSSIQVVVPGNLPLEQTKSCFELVVSGQVEGER